MKTHKSPRKPGMHSVHDSKGSSSRTMGSSSLSTKTIVIITSVVIGVLFLMYLMMAT